MRRAMSNPEARLVAALARHLLSPSTRFEDPAQLAQDATRDGLRCLASLEKSTKLSLPIPPTEPQVAAQPTPEPAAYYGTQRAEYKPALNNPSIVDALLEFHHRTRVPAGSAQAPLAGFRPSSVPMVQAQPKPAPSSSSRRTTRVYRPRNVP